MNVCATTGKTGYPSRSAASKARAQYTRRRRRPAESQVRRQGELQVFRCRFCFDWHMGHKVRGNRGGQSL